MKLLSVSVETLAVLGACDGCGREMDSEHFRAVYKVVTKERGGWPTVKFYHPACWTAPRTERGE